MKLYEILSNNTGASFDLTVGTETRTLILERFSVDTLVKYENDGLDITTIFDNINKQQSTWITKLAFDLMSQPSKDEFNNDLEIFRKCIDTGSLKTVSEAVFKTIENSQPKNVQTESLPQ